jgi:hypothetical protein
MIMTPPSGLEHAKLRRHKHALTFSKLNTHPFPQPVGLLRKRPKDPRTKASIGTQLNRVVCGIKIRIFKSEWYASSAAELTEKGHSHIRSNSACAGILLHQTYQHFKELENMVLSMCSPLSSRTVLVFSFPKLEATALKQSLQK